MPVLKLADRNDTVNIVVIGNELWLDISSDVKLVLRFVEKSAVADLIRGLRAIARRIDGRDTRVLERLFYPTIATIDLEYIADTCYEHWTQSCRWAHDFREFIELNEKEVNK